MPGHYEKGVFIEEPEIDTLANDALNAAFVYFQKYNDINQPVGVVWIQAGNGFTMICTPNPKYANKLKQTIGRLK